MKTSESINVVDAERQALLEPIAPHERAPFWQVALALVIVQASLLHVHVQTQNFQSSHKITATGPTALTLHSDATANMLGTNAPCAPPTPVRSNLPPFPFLSLLSLVSDWIRGVRSVSQTVCAGCICECGCIFFLQRSGLLSGLADCCCKYLIETNRHMWACGRVGMWRVGVWAWCVGVCGKRWFLDTQFSLEGRSANSNCAFTPASALGGLSSS